jgi:hypothetical protein
MVNSDRSTFPAVSHRLLTPSSPVIRRLDNRPIGSDHKNMKNGKVKYSGPQISASQPEICVFTKVRLDDKSRVEMKLVTSVLSVYFGTSVIRYTSVLRTLNSCADYFH